MLRNTLIGMILLVGLPGMLGGQAPQPTPQHFPGTGPHNAADTDPLSPKMQEQQVMARANERQKKLVSDTEKLLELATDLKMQVGKTNRDILSVDVIKKADEIEKLAHSVKERMKG
jgi:hypothetical protein